MLGTIYSGQYEVQELIAQGGMGAVYKALDQKLNRIVALKVVHPHLSGDPSFLNRFLREARDMARLPHENIVTIFAVGQDQATHYLVMEYFPGTNLRDMISSTGAFPLSKAVSITRQMANALSYAHSHGIIHRDIKPANVLVATDNRAKLTDFGIAAALDHAPLTSTGQIIGSLPYMPPEQARDATLDGRSDLYSLGMTFYELLTGVNPRRNLSNTVILGMLLSEDNMQPLEFPASVPPGIQQVVNDLLRYRPTDRIQDADTLLERLEALRPIWGDSSTINQTPNDAFIIIKAVPKKTAASGSNIDDKTVAVLDPRLASGSNAPIREKATKPEPKVNKKPAVYTVLLTMLLLCFAIGGYYYSTYQNPTFEETSTDTAPSRTAQAPQKGSAEVPKTEGAETKVIGQATSEESIPNQMPSRPTKQATDYESLEDKELSPTKAADQKPSMKNRPTQERRSDKTTFQGTMPRQKPSEIKEKPQTTNKIIQNKVPSTAKTPQPYAQLPTKKPDSQNTPGQATMPDQEPNITASKAQSGQTVEQNTETKVAMVANSTAETRGLRDLLEKLRTGIVNKDLPAVERMSVLSENRRRLLGEMFENYSSIDASVGEVKSGPQDAEAVILINKLILPNGESIDPAPLVRRTPITIPREGDNWGRIIW
jgi:serine/threonine protein kinase